MRPSFKVRDDDNDDDNDDDEDNDDNDDDDDNHNDEKEDDLPHKVHAFFLFQKMELGKMEQSAMLKSRTRKMSL